MNDSKSKKQKSTLKTYNNYQDFIGAHSLSKEDEREITNTSIMGGRFHIPNDEYDQFLNMYYQDIVKPGNTEYLTEKQLVSGGPIAIDIDLRYNYDIKERQHNSEFIHSLILIYLEELSNIFQFNEDYSFDIFVQEKKSVNRIANKNITKDGIHILIGIQSDRAIQLILRDRVMKNAVELFSELPIINTLEDVFDKGVSAGSVNWQLFGSCKPEHEAYGLTGIYKFEYDADDGEFIETKLSPKKFNWSKDFSKLSVRYRDNLAPFMKAAFRTGEYEEMNNSLMNSKRGKMRRTTSKNVIELKTIDDIKEALKEYKENLKPVDFEKRDIIDYVDALPESYYGTGSYNNWIRVGWALANINKDMFIVWLAFSAKSDTFSMSSIDELKDLWNGFENNNPDGLTKLSILYWVRESAPDEFKRIRNNSVDKQIQLTINNNLVIKNKNYGCGDTDIAKILNMMYKQEFACAGIKADKWYRYEGHRWVEDECGTTLRKNISNELIHLYVGKLDILSNQLSRDNIDEKTMKLYENQANKLTDIITHLSSTTHKDHILKEARELFYDANIRFMDLLDSNPKLMCFKNGVIDFQTKTFRRGRAEDYLEKCTNINYVPLDRNRDAKIIAEINDFMEKLFPIERLRNYMWDHFASILIGGNASQKMHMYIGQGENGKSVLTDLMSKCLGDYYSVVPLSLITQARQKQGQASPDIVALKGLRMAVMQEPSKDDCINEGPMKELVSCVEPVKGRNLFSTPITFIPQMQIIVCSNNFMKVNSQDHGTWRRIAVVDFMSRFTDNPQDDDPENPYQYKKDTTLKDRFGEWSEVFMAMLVEKAFMLEDGKVKPCDLVDKSSNSYRQSQDEIAEFVAEKIVKCDDGKLTKTELAAEWDAWYRSTYGRGGPSIKEVHEHINKIHGKCKKGTWTGIKYDHNSISYDNNDVNDTEDSDSGDEIEALDIPNDN